MGLAGTSTHRASANWIGQRVSQSYLSIVFECGPAPEVIDLGAHRHDSGGRVEGWVKVKVTWGAVIIYSERGLEGWD